MIYGLFGADFILVAWVDELLAWLIEHYVSNFTFLAFVFGGLIWLFLIWAWLSPSLSGGADIVVLFTITQALLGLLWWLTMQVSVNAIRRVDPAWNKLDEGDLLWPTLFYVFGFVEWREQGEGPGEDPEAQSSEASGEEVAWTL